jgi:hypothetical protein
MRGFDINELKTIKKVSIRKNPRTIFLADYKIMRIWFNMRSKHLGITDVFVRLGDLNIICNYKTYNRVLLLDGSRDVQSYLMTIIFCMCNFVLWGTLY